MVDHAAWPIAEWGLNMNKKTIQVNTENFQTNKRGIYAVGDICSYPGKLSVSQVFMKLPWRQLNVLKADLTKNIDFSSHSSKEIHDEAQKY